MLVVSGLSFLIATLYVRLLSISLFVYSVIELTSALALYRRLGAEAATRSQNQATWDRRDRRTEQFSGFLLYAMILSVVVHAAYSFTQAHHTDVPLITIVVAYVASVALPFLAKAKHRLAMRIGSRALRLNAITSFACGYLCLMVLVGLSASRIHDWWIDTFGALMILPLLIKEALGTRVNEL